MENEKNVILTTDIRPEDCLIEPKIRTYGPYNLPVDEIVQKYKAGKGSHILADEYKKYNPNVTHNSIIGLLSKENVLRKKEKRKFSDSDIYEKYKKLITWKKTADYFKISSSAAGRAIKKSIGILGCSETQNISGIKKIDSEKVKPYPVLEEKLTIPKTEKIEYDIDYNRSCKDHTLGHYFNIGQMIVSGYVNSNLKFKN